MVCDCAAIKNLIAAKTSFARKQNTDLNPCVHVCKQNGSEKAYKKRLSSESQISFHQHKCDTLQ